MLIVNECSNSVARGTSTSSALCSCSNVVDWWEKESRFLVNGTDFFGRKWRADILPQAAKASKKIIVRVFEKSLQVGTFFALGAALLFTICSRRKSAHIVNILIHAICVKIRKNKLICTSSYYYCYRLYQFKHKKKNDNNKNYFYLYSHIREQGRKTQVILEGELVWIMRIWLCSLVTECYLNKQAVKIITRWLEGHSRTVSLSLFIFNSMWNKNSFPSLIVVNVTRWRKKGFSCIFRLPFIVYSC